MTLKHEFLNYAKGDENNVSVPRSFKARPYSEQVNLAYITPEEEGILQALRPGTPHRGPMEVPNYDSFDAAGGYSNPDTGYSASSGGGGGGWRDTSAQDRQIEQRWQATKDAIKKAEKQKKIIGGADKSLDFYTLLNAAKTGAFKYNPVTHGISYLLGVAGKKRRSLKNQVSGFDDIDFDEIDYDKQLQQLRDYFEGITPGDLGLPKEKEKPSVDWDIRNKVATGPQSFLPGLEPINTMNNPTWNSNTQQFEYNMGNIAKAEQLTLPGMLNMPSGYPWSVSGEGASPQSWITKVAHGGRVGFSKGGIVDLWQELSNL